MNNRVIVIADVSNLYYSIGSQFNGAKLNYSKLYDFCKGYGRIYRAIAYGAAIGSEADAFKAALIGIGFETRYKEPKIYHQDNGTQYRKADWDVAMAMDLVRYVDCFDTAILCTADGDLTSCVEWLNFKGKFTTIIGSNISRDLKNTAYQWKEIDYAFIGAAEQLVLRADLPSDAIGSAT